MDTVLCLCAGRTCEEMSWKNGWVVSFALNWHGSGSKVLYAVMSWACVSCISEKISTGRVGIVATKTLFSAQLSQHRGIVLGITGCLECHSTLGLRGNCICMWCGMLLNQKIMILFNTLIFGMSRKISTVLFLFCLDKRYYWVNQKSVPCFKAWAT